MKMLMVVVVLLMSGCSAQDMAMLAQGYADASAGGYRQPYQQNTVYHEDTQRQASREFFNQNFNRLMSTPPPSRQINCHTIGTQVVCY